jgi:hypothetical protein
MLQAPHIRPGEADPYEQEGNLAARRCQTQVERHRQDRSRAGANPVNRGHDRLWAGAHCLDQIAGHPREGEQARHVAFALHLDATTLAQDRGG